MKIKTVKNDPHEYMDTWCQVYHFTIKTTCNFYKNGSTWRISSPYKAFFRIWLKVWLNIILSMRVQGWDIYMRYVSHYELDRPNAYTSQSLNLRGHLILCPPTFRKWGTCVSPPPNLIDALLWHIRWGCTNFQGQYVRYVTVNIIRAERQIKKLCQNRSSPCYKLQYLDFFREKGTINANWFLIFQQNRSLT